MDLSQLAWRKAKASGDLGGQCVEVAIATEAESGTPNKASEDHRIVVRDSKNPAKGTLEFTLSEWNAFIDAAKRGEFDTEHLLSERTSLTAV